MQNKNLIKERIVGYEDFLNYCKESGKRFVDELDREDFIAYRAEYSVPRERVEQIKKLLGFREHKSAEKFSAPQDVSDNLAASDASLGKWFGVVDLSPYKDVLIADMAFNNRVKNRLSSNGYRTLAELLKSSRQEISDWKNFGKKSLANLFATLKDFFDSRKETCPANAFQLANEGLDKFLRNAALNHAPQIDLIITAFEKFCASVTIKDFFRNLPDEFKSKRARPFLTACGLRVALPDDLTLAELIEFLSENRIDFEDDKLKHFVTALRFDVRACAKRIVADLFDDEREFDVVYRRAKGDTLEGIGKNFGVTRERVRQLEAKSVGKFNKHRADTKKIVCFLRALTDGQTIVTADDAKNFLDAADAEIFWFLSAKTKLSNNVFHFNAELNAFVFADGAALDEDKLIEGLPNIMEEKFFEETITNWARENGSSLELAKIKLAKIYKHKGKVFYHDKLTLISECAYVLKERFPTGYKIGDEAFYSRFMRYFQDIFEEKTPLTQRNVDAKISAAGFLCDRGKYIHPDFVHISADIMERVKNFIDASDRTAIFYKEIFETLKDFFVGTQITNHYFLQGAIKLHNLPYTLRKDYLTKASAVDMGKEFDSFVAERGEVSLQEIKEHFISFEDFNITFLVERCPDIIRAGDGILIHATRLNLNEDDFAPIKNFLRRICSTPVTSRALLGMFFEHFADFMTRNDIQNHSKLFGVLQYMFRDKFNFSRPYISAADIKDINNKKFLLSLLGSLEKIEIADLVGICDEHGIHYVARTCLIDSLRPDFIRVDEFSLMRPESIGVTDEIFSAVIESIRAAVARNGGWQAAQTFEDYEWLPRLEAPWNSFLLESVTSLADDAPYSLKSPSTSVKFSSTVFLSEAFAEDDFQSFLTKILIAEHNKEPFRSEKDIFNWLKGQGLCNKKLPKFLESGRAFELLGE